MGVAGGIPRYERLRREYGVQVFPHADPLRILAESTRLLIATALGVGHRTAENRLYIVEMSAYKCKVEFCGTRFILERQHLGFE